MLFGSAELARRIERAECGLVEDCTAAVERSEGGAFALPLAGGVAAFSGAQSPLTKVAGLGFDGLPSEAELARVEAEFGERGAPVQVELSTLAESGISERLTARGYALVGFENVLARALRPEDHAAERWAPRAGITVEHCPDAAFEEWLDVVVSAFAAPDTQGVASHESFPRESIDRVIRAMTGARGMVRYLARREGAAAGGASMRISDGVAQLCGAGTLREHRRRGVQAALLERRLAEAARAGCELAVVTTLPGSKSQENVLRTGFELVYVRAILRREPR
jgi:acetyltransferase (GNAT) family protein